MNESEQVDRFLGLVRRELGAVDARLELGGRPPTAPEAVWEPFGDGWRAVALFRRPPLDRDESQQRLAELIRSFRSTLESIAPPSFSRPVDPSPASRLDESLLIMAERAQARAAVVVDARSEVRWGIACRQPLPDRVLERACQLARGFDGGDWLQVREDDFGLLVRRFAAIYRLALLYDGPFSELAARGLVHRALPVIERLVASLPPIDPEPQGARVTPLRRPSE